MEAVQKFLAKELVWLIGAFVFAFPLALIPLSVVDGLTVDYEAFMEAINGQVVLLYFVFVAACFVGIFMIRAVSSAIRTLLE